MLPASRRARASGRILADPYAPQLRHDVFAQDLPSTAWLAGLIAADGCVNKNLLYLTITQSGPAGRAIIDEVRRLTNHQLTISVRLPQQGQPVHSIHLGSPQMVEDLRRRFGVTPRKSLTYEWPDPPPHMASAFLRGYVDGDGCVGIYRTPQGNPMPHMQRRKAVMTRLASGSTVAAAAAATGVSAGTIYDWLARSRKAQLEQRT